MKKYLSIPFVVISGFLLLSFTFGNKPSLKTALKTLNGFCKYIPSGNAFVEGDTVSVQAFYMSNEITNFQYAEFIHYLKQKGETEKLKIAKIDTAAWVTAFPKGYMKPMSEFYSTHPAYRDYPVVNITKEGAELYCEWLSMMYDSLSSGELSLKFRIPTRAEYIRAARGDNHSKIYTWSRTSLYHSEGKFCGQMQANCIRNGAECITRNKETGKLEYTHAAYPEIDFTSDGAFLTAQSESYWPNDFGLYNINGNVSEMISDGPFAVGGDWNSPGYDIRNESIKPFTSAHPTVGFRVVASYILEDK